MRIVRLFGPSAVLAAVAGLVLAVPAAAQATPAGTLHHPCGAVATTGDSCLVVSRQDPNARVPFVARTSGEALVDLTAAAPGTDWGISGAESAVVSVSVDNRYETDLVVTGGQPLHRQLALGRLPAGRHLLLLHFAAERSAPASSDVALDAIHVSTYSPRSPDYLVLRYAPVVYGRNLPELGSPYQNAIGDTPLVAWHEITPAATPGHRVLTYSLVWSHEDGGTSAPALMARWGRTTDIEWVYSVEVDSNGDRVPGSDTFQAASHETLHFTGRYEAGHPLLQTCTSNNNMCDVVNDPMRFFLSTLQTRPEDQAREYIMDTNPWTYPIMAKEMIREGQIEPPSPATALTPAVSDQRNYLYVVVKKTTTLPNDGSSWVGLALGVRLVGGSTVYMSNHVDPTWSIQRDDPAATTVELPAGTTARDIAEITVHRIVVGTDTGAAIHVTAIKRGFFLGADYLPQPSFLSWNGDILLDASTPSAVIWTPPAGGDTKR